MVNLTRIYTRTGDDGTTSLGDMSRTGKNDPRLKAYADVDEANCAIGMALACSDMSDDVRASLVAVQNDLFDVGADLCTPVVDNPPYEPLRVTQAYVDELERLCDRVIIVDHGRIQRIVDVRAAAGTGDARRWRVQLQTGAEALAALLPDAVVRGDRVECTADLPALNRALAQAIAQGALVSAVVPAESSLEEAFRTAVTR